MGAEGRGVGVEAAHEGGMRTQGDDGGTDLRFGTAGRCLAHPFGFQGGVGVFLCLGGGDFLVMRRRQIVRRRRSRLARGGGVLVRRRQQGRQEETTSSMIRRC